MRCRCFIKNGAKQSNKIISVIKIVAVKYAVLKSKVEMIKKIKFFIVIFFSKINVISANKKSGNGS